jgi:two-component system sensor histidine kinase HydH
MQRTGEWRRWGAWATVVVTVLAALSLGITVAVAAAGFEASSSVLVRGEAEAIVRDLERRIGAQELLPTNAELEAMRAARTDEGLRYVALFQPDGSLVSSSGTPTMDAAGDAHLGTVRIVAGRARLAEVLPPPSAGHPHPQALRPEPPRDPTRDPARDPTRDPTRDLEHDLPHDPMRAPPHPPPRDPLSQGARAPQGGLGPPMPPTLVVELEPPLRAQFAMAIRRTVLVASVSAALLLSAGLFFARRALLHEATAQQAEVERRLAALGRMSAVVAHELRNPLASLKGHAQLLAESLEPKSPALAKAERVVADAERIERLTDDLLTIVRDGPIDRRAVETSMIVAEVVSAVADPRVKVIDADAPTTLSIDRPRIVAALTNVLRNASQASDVGSIELTIAHAGTATTILVRDHGPGLPAGDSERIFEPFVTHRTRGTGLGLTVARRAVEQHGGTIEGHNHADGGAVFRIVLPD